MGSFNMLDTMNKFNEMKDNQNTLLQKVEMHRHWVEIDVKRLDKENYHLNKKLRELRNLDCTCKDGAKGNPGKKGAVGPIGPARLDRLDQKEPRAKKEKRGSLD